MTSVASRSYGISDLSRSADLAEFSAEQIYKVDGVRAQIEEHSASANIGILLPACRTLNISTAIVQIFCGKGKYPSKSTLVDQLLGSHNGSDKSVVENDIADKTAVSCKLSYLVSLCGSNTKGLFAVDVLSCGNSLFESFVMINIGGANVDNVYFGIVYEIVLTVGCNSEAVFLGNSKALFLACGTNAVYLCIKVGMGIVVFQIVDTV